jgi:hypothetical protein
MKLKITLRHLLLVLVAVIALPAAQAQQSGSFLDRFKDHQMNHARPLMPVLKDGMRLPFPRVAAHADRKPTALNSRIVAYYQDTFDGTGYRAAGDSTRFFWSGTRGAGFLPDMIGTELAYGLLGALPPQWEIELYFDFFASQNYDSAHRYRCLVDNNRDTLTYRELNTLNAAGMAVTSVSKRLESGLWEDKNKVIKTYSTDNRLTSYTEQEWDGATWENDDRYTLSYNSGKISELVIEDWDMGTMSWENDEKTVHSYSGNDRTQLVEKNWNTVTLAWDDDYRQLYTYDNGLWTVMIGQYWNEDSSKWLNDNRVVITYDSDGKLERLTNQTWDEPNSQWKNAYRRNYAYDASGNLTTLITQDWDSGTQSWDNGNRATYTYSSQGNGTRTRMTVEDWDSGIPGWEYTFRYAIDYDEYGHITQIVTEDWDGAIFEPRIGNSKLVFLYEEFEDAGINETARQTSFRYFPNPTTTQITVESRNIETVSVLDMTGRTVRELKAPGQSSRITISTADLAPGMYLLQVRHNGLCETARLAIQ